MSELHLLYEKDPSRKVAYVTFNRPEKLNALVHADYLEIARICNEVNGDEDVKVLVFRGRSRAFGTGHDIAELGVMHDQASGQQGVKERRPSQRKRLFVDRGLYGRPGFLQAILYCQKATVAQVHGLCYGGHFEIMNCCDIAIASEDAQFTHPGYGYIGPTTEIGLMIETVGLKIVKEMMLARKILDAQEAVARGLINRVVPMDRLEDETNALVDSITRLPFDGIVMGKAAFEAALDALGVGSTWTAAYIGHALQTGIRYEPGEFNLLKERRDTGVKGAIVGREGHYLEEQH